jgi:hypothetical protein
MATWGGITPLDNNCWPKYDYQLYYQPHTEQDCVLTVIELLKELKELKSKAECPHCEKSSRTAGEDIRLRYLERMLEELL